MRKNLFVLVVLLLALVVGLTPALAQSQPDRDADGIPDAEDQCPDLFAVNTGAGATGCPNGPNFDTDGDGVVDSQDLCPVTFAADGGQDDTGCPPEVFAPPLEGDAAATTPVQPTDGDCAGSLAPRLAVGMTGQIARTYSTLRNVPAGTPVYVVYSPATFTVLEGPVCAGYGPLTWYRIDYGDGRTGWASESQVYSMWGNNLYWLEPVVAQPAE